MALKQIVYKKGQTAGDILRDLMKQRKKDKAGYGNRDYNIAEFSKNELVDINGDLVKCRMWKGISWANIDELISDYEVSSIDSRTFAAWSKRIEHAIGAPAIEPPNELPQISLRPLDEIANALARYKKKATYEVKNLKQINPEIKEPSNPRVIGGLKTLSWLFNGGKQRLVKEIVEHLFRLIVFREREKLFYMHIRPNNPNFFICFDDETNEQIEIMRWVILHNKNPLEGGRQHGQSSLQ